jgi:hypothetical protein
MSSFLAPVISGAVSKIKKSCNGLACSSKLKEMGMNEDMRLFSLLLNNCFTFLNAELNGNRGWLMLLPQRDQK